MVVREDLGGMLSNNLAAPRVYEPVITLTVFQHHSRFSDHVSACRLPNSVNAIVKW